MKTTSRPRIMKTRALLAVAAGLLLGFASLGYAQDIETVEVLASTAVSGTADIISTISNNNVVDIDGFRHTTFENAGTFNTGLVMVNQDTGTGNNQSNVRVLALTNLTDGGLIEENLLTVIATTTDNKVLTVGGERSNTITGSFGGTVGVVGINQASGSLNHEINTFVMTAGLGLTTETGELPDVVTVKSAALAHVKSGNEVDPDSAPGPQSNRLVDNFAGFRGFAQVNQATGDLNFLNNNISLSVRTAEIR